MEDACMHVADNDGTNNEKESGERMGGGGKGLPHGDIRWSWLPYGGRAVLAPPHSGYAGLGTCPRSIFSRGGCAV